MAAASRTGVASAATRSGRRRPWFALARGAGGLEATLGIRGDVEIGVEVRGGGVGLDRLRDAHLERPVDERPLVHVVPVDEGHGDPGLARAPGAPRAVQVGVVVLGDRVVDDVGHVEHVDAACGDIRRDEDVLLAGLEGGHGPLALLLVEVAVHGGGVEAPVAELLDEFGRGTLGAGEDHGLAPPLGLEDAGDDLVLVERVRPVDDVLDVRLGEALVGVGRPDVDGPVHEPACERHDRSRHGRREEHGVTRWRRLREELLDVGEEPEVEHLVGLVEHHDLDLREGEHPLAREVEQASRRADHDLRPVLQLLDLALIGLAAVDRGDLRRAVRRGHDEVLGHLDAQLARRDDDERLDPRLRIGAEVLEEREAEAERLARSGLGLADDVLAPEAERDGLRLDGERFENALGGECVDHVLVDAEF